MKKLVFEPSDFCLVYYSNKGPPPIKHTHEIAQAKFDEWYRENIESAPLVYGKHPAPQEYIGNWANKETDCDTHTARLIDIQEIKKECVKHEPNVLNQKLGGWYCRHCEAELIPEWKVKP